MPLRKARAAVLGLLVAVSPGTAAEPPRTEWLAGRANHPQLGNIHFAAMNTLVETAVGPHKIHSRAYVSCQKAEKRMAVELTNTVAPSDPAGLPPASPPRLVCVRTVAAKGRTPVREELQPQWAVNRLGDALGSGLAPASLRACGSLAVIQDVKLPEGWPQKSARVEFSIDPAIPELDAVFVMCGEPSRYVTVAPVAATAAPTAAPEAPPPPKSGEGPWRTVRTVGEGKTNVRAKPSTQAAVVTQVAPGAVLLGQPALGEWWRVKAASGPAFEGFVREDRLDARPGRTP